MLQPGTQAPDFTTTLDDGTPFRLSEAIKERAVVLYFYPKDDSKGCTIQACSFRDRFEDITAKGAMLVGISTDDEASHANFRQKHDLPFPLIADKDQSIQKAYEARSLFGIARARVTYVIGRDGLIHGTIRHDIAIGRHVTDVLEVLEKIGQTTSA
jgi:thioredoxin-dependent peroxiredoxin